MPSVPAFPGFAKELVIFLKGLERNNSKAWFDAHRDDYEALYLEPAKGFATAIAPALAKLDPRVVCEPRVNGAIMRINRDTRFSTDKTPYKTAMHFRFPSGPGRNGAGYFLRIAADSVGVAGGAWAFDPKMMARYRKAVVDPVQGKALRAAISRVQKAGPYEISEPEYKRVPKDLDPDQPNAELLRHKSFFASAELGLAKEIFTPGAVAYVMDHFKKLRPVQNWLADVVG